MNEKKTKGLLGLLKEFCSIQKIDCRLVEQDLVHPNKIEFNFQSRRSTHKKKEEKIVLLAKVELWKEENLIAIELHQGPLTNGYLELANEIKELDVSVILYCQNKDGAPVIVFDSRTPPKNS